MSGMVLEQIIGHRRVIDALVQAHLGGTPHHAYLFAGPEGIGKRRVARAFAALVNCLAEAGAARDACGQCRSCRRILRPEGDGDDSEAVEHPDVMELAPEPGKRSIGIDRVRAMIKVVPFPPIEARARFILVEPADALTEAAANAMLKTLEEPSSHTRFILVTARPDALLTTIISRCQRVTFGRLSDAEVEQGLVSRLGVDQATARDVTSMADGSLGAAMALLKDPIMQQRGTLVRRIAAIAPGDAQAAFDLAADLLDERDAWPTVFQLLYRLYRDVLLYRLGADATVSLSNPDLREPLDGMAKRLGARAIEHRLELIADTEHGVRQRNLNLRTSLERLLLALTAAPGEEGTAVRVRDAFTSRRRA